MVGYTEVIQDGHRADQYPEFGLWAVICCFCVYVLTEIHSGSEVGFQEVTMIKAFGA